MYLNYCQVTQNVFYELNATILSTYNRQVKEIRWFLEPAVQYLVDPAKLQGWTLEVIGYKVALPSTPGHTTQLTSLSHHQNFSISVFFSLTYLFLTEEEKHFYHPVGGTMVLIVSFTF